jgi:hypothetical protein
VGVYDQFTYTGLYPGIDMSLYSSSNQLKYDLIVHPGSNAASIVLDYAGADSLSIVNEVLHIHTSVGDLIESKPFTCQEIVSLLFWVITIPLSI